MSGTVIVSQLGARMHYAVPRIFEQAGELERLYTDICGAKGLAKALRALPSAALPAPVRRLLGRVPHGISSERIRCFEAFGVALGLRRTFAGVSKGTKTTLAAARGFSRAVVREGFGAAEGFYGISGECLEQLQAARHRGLWTVVEQIVAPKDVLDRLIAVEHRRHPGWDTALVGDRWAEEYAARERAEWQIADLIICPSEFVRSAVAEVGGPVERCVVVPYGVDAGLQVEPMPRDATEPLRVLTVGQVSLRKGAPYVLEAATRLAGTARFKMVGPLAVSEARQEQLRATLDLVGPTPRSNIAAHFGSADVFFLPTVCEGSATAIYEALAAGLPVVTTANAGSVVRDGVEGFICPVGDVDGFCDKLSRLAEDRSLLRSMSEAALTTAPKYNVAGYGVRLLEALRPLRHGNMAEIARERSRHAKAPQPTGWLPATPR